jgi:hypothetical protein
MAISRRNVLLTESLRFLSTWLFWELNYSELANGNDEFIQPCLEQLADFEKLETIFAEHNMGVLPNFREIRDCIETHDLNDADGLRTVFQFDELLQLMKTIVLTQRHQEQFLEEQLGEVPY